MSAPSLTNATDAPGGWRVIAVRSCACALSAALLSAPLVVAAAADGIDRARPAVSRFTLERRFDLDVKTERNFDLDQRRRDNAAEAEPLLLFDVTYRAGPRWLGSAEIELGGQFERASGKPSERAAFLRVDQFYVGYEGLVELRVGRWTFRDEREWLFDADIDGVHARFDDDRIEIDALAGRVRYWRRDLLGNKSTGDPIDNYALLAGYEWRERASVGGYVVLRNDTSREQERFVFVGLRSHGEPSDALRYWAELAHVRGRDGGRKVRGHGLDVRAAYSFGALRWRPRFILGYARGSGDGDLDDNTDRSHRQTGLQGNEARLGGLAKYKYYGEALDPELSNIGILSAGIGFSPSRRVSIDLLLHRYRQPVLSERLRVEVDPGDDMGSSRHVGDEIDLVAGYRPNDGTLIEFVLGRFRPGSRFRNQERGADVALFGRFELKVDF
jgi:alginate production protein